MRTEETAIEIVSEFMSPFEDRLTVLLLGDRFQEDDHQEISAAFDRARKDFTELPNVINKHMLPVDTRMIGTDDLFRGRIEELVREQPCVIYLDKDISRDIINILTNNDHEVDDLEAMLLEKYVIGIGQEKFIFDLTDTSEDRLQLLLAGMDARAGEFNYIIVENLMGVWIYETDEFTFIQVP
jgi:hypothetical protein